MSWVSPESLGGGELAPPQERVSAGQGGWNALRHEGDWNSLRGAKAPLGANHPVHL